jgi:hypothetical protein
MKLSKRRNKMLRMVAVFAMVAVFVGSSSAADLVSMKLCAAGDYDSAARDCTAGKALEGNSIQVDPSLIGSLYFLTAVKTSGNADIYHVWISGKSSSAVMVYDSATKTLREPESAELAWLKERNIESAQVIVKMTASPSERFRLRSSKTLTPAMSGAWKVQVYDGAGINPLGEMDFTLVRFEKRITE